MHIDEDKALLRISDQNLVRAWFKVGPTSKPRWKKQKKKEIIVVKKDEESLEQCRETLRKHIGKKHQLQQIYEKTQNISKPDPEKKKKDKGRKEG